MNVSILRRRWLAASAASSILALTGCAATGAAADDQAALLQRAQAYWSNIKANDRVAAWAYEEVSKDPTWTLEVYLKRGGVVYDMVEVLGVRRLEGDVAIVDVRMRYRVPMLRLKDQEVTAQDEWRRINGVWHHVIKRSLALPS